MIHVSQDTPNDFVVMNDDHIKLLIFCKNNNDINNAISKGPSEISSLVNNTTFPDQKNRYWLYKLGEHKNWHSRSELQRLISEKFGDDCVKYISDIFQRSYYTQKQYDSTLKTHDIDPDDVREFDDEGYDQYGYDREGYDREGYDENGFDDEGHDSEGTHYDDK